MTERPDGQDDRQQRTLALAKAIRAEIEAYNQQHPTTPFPIDDAVSRIIANDPEYIPPRKRRANRKRPPTENPGIFTVQKIAGDLGTTVGTLLREKGFEITNSDLRTFRWIHDFLAMRFVAGSAPEIALPDESGFRVKDFTFPRQLATTKITRAGELAAGPVGRESEFEMTEAEFAGSLKGPGLVAAQVQGRSMADRMRDGDMIVIDTRQTRPRQGDPVAVHVENEGGILGYWRAEAGSYYLDKHNIPDFKPVKLPHESEWRVLGVVILVQSPVRRQDRPTREPNSHPSASTDFAIEILDDIASERTQQWLGIRKGRQIHRVVAGASVGRSARRSDGFSTATRNSSRQSKTPRSAVRRPAGGRAGSPSAPARPDVQRSGRRTSASTSCGRRTLRRWRATRPASAATAPITSRTRSSRAGSTRPRGVGTTRIA